MATFSYEKQVSHLLFFKGSTESLCYPGLILGCHNSLASEKPSHGQNSTQEHFNLKIIQISPKISSPGGLEPPTFRLTAERADRLRHGDGAEPHFDGM